VLAYGQEENQGKVLAAARTRIGKKQQGPTGRNTSSRDRESDEGGKKVEKKMRHKSEGCSSNNEVGGEGTGKSRTGRDELVGQFCTQQKMVQGKTTGEKP